MTEISIPLSEMVKISIFFCGIVFFVVRFAVGGIISRLDKMETNIGKVHDRLDQHIIEWHKESKR